MLFSIIWHDQLLVMEFMLLSTILFSTLGSALDADLEQRWLDANLGWYLIDCLRLDVGPLLFGQDLIEPKVWLVMMNFGLVVPIRLDQVDLSQGGSA